MHRTRGVALFFFALLGWTLALADDDTPLGELRHYVRSWMAA